MKYRSIAEFSSRLAAETYGHVLEQKGIPFIVKSDDLGISGGAGGQFGASLWVPEEWAERARLVLPCIFPEEDDEGEPVSEPSGV